MMHNTHIHNRPGIQKTSEEATSKVWICQHVQIWRQFIDKIRQQMFENEPRGISLCDACKARSVPACNNVGDDNAWFEGENS